MENDTQEDSAAAPVAPASEQAAPTQAAPAEPTAPATSDLFKIVTPVDGLFIYSYNGKLHQKEAKAVSQNGRMVDVEMGVLGTPYYKPGGAKAMRFENVPVVINPEEAKHQTFLPSDPGDILLPPLPPPPPTRAERERAEMLAMLNRLANDQAMIWGSLRDLHVSQDDQTFKLQNIEEQAIQISALNEQIETNQKKLEEIRLTLNELLDQVDGLGDLVQTLDLTETGRAFSANAINQSPAAAAELEVEPEEKVTTERKPPAEIKEEVKA